ncbi:MAG: hypothetical protein MJ102_00465 [Clostridia bacterium]|nr:hypothetical protein [Clostridia bacterium]
MKRNHYLLSIAAFLMAMICIALAGCTGNDTYNVDNGTSDLSSSVTETDTSAYGKIVLIDKNKNDFSIIRGMYAEIDEIEAAKQLNSAFTSKFSSTWDFVIKDDFVKGASKDDVISDNAREILVGYTNRKESRETFVGLKKDQYVIKFVGSKLVIIGSDQYSTLAAVEEFVKNVVEKNETSELFALSPDFVLTGTAKLRQVSINPEASYRLFSWNLGCYVGGSTGSSEAVKIILRYLPDILACQESDKKVHSNILQKVLDSNSDYAYAMKMHPGTSTYNYTPIIYKKTLFDLVDSGVEWLDGRYTGTNTKSLSWAVFKDKNDIQFAMVNFHGAVCSATYKGYEDMTSEERTAQALAWKIDNVRQVLGVRDRIYAEYGEIPFTVNGDCNFNSDSVPYANMIKGGMYDAEKTAKIKTTGYTTSFTYGNFYKSGKSIDHIFGINGIDFVVFEIVRDAEVKTASDHCPVYVDYNIGIK